MSQRDLSSGPLRLEDMSAVVGPRITIKCAGSCRIRVTPKLSYKRATDHLALSPTKAQCSVCGEIRSHP